MRQRQQLEHSLADFRRIERDFEDNLTLIELGEAEGDAATVDEGEGALQRLDEEVQRKSIEAMLSGEADGMDTYIEVHAGAGGTESQDWASMLTRMYMRWGERRGFKVNLIDESPGEEAGIKSATLEIQGENAYGWLKTEAGVHSNRRARYAPVGARPIRSSASHRR
jgi:peptide chain release factor 2